LLDKEAERLRTQTKSFNSVVVVNAKGVIISVSPETLQVKGVRLVGERKRQSLNAQPPVVTEPFISPAGNYLLTISYPIFSQSNEYLGYIGG
ncbi:PDC sensor domain-containing protein, partial [Escherichia coli]|nr:PDC sensor domain-containing protein [Escherichia coli]